MIEYYITGPEGTAKTSALQPGSWVNVVEPTEDDRAWLASELGIVPEFLTSALDEEERAHVDYDDDEDQTLVIVDYPEPEAVETATRDSQADHQTDPLYDTQPISVVLLPRRQLIVTISLRSNDVVQDFARGKVRQLDTRAASSFLLLLLLRIAQLFQRSLRVIDRRFSKTEKRLRSSMRNDALIEMLGIEKSLVYFSTSLKSDEATLGKIGVGRVVPLGDDEKDLLDDVSIEFKQAVETCAVYSNILSGTMEAFSNVIANSLNIVMRRLTVITIVLAMPTIVFSFYGMNVDLPLAGSFWIPLVISAAACVAAILIFTKGKAFK